MKICFGCKHFDTAACEWCDEMFDDQYEEAEEGSLMHVMHKWAILYKNLMEQEPSIYAFSEMYDWMKEHFEEVKDKYD